MTRTVCHLARPTTAQASPSGRRFAACFLASARLVSGIRRAQAPSSFEGRLIMPVNCAALGRLSMPTFPRDVVFSLVTDIYVTY